jgi:hypothetical protein
MSLEISAIVSRWKTSKTKSNVRAWYMWRSRV